MALTIKIIRFDHGSERRAIEKYMHVELIPSIMMKIDFSVNLRL